MELGLNLVWMALTTLMCWQWMRHAPSRGARRTQIVALSLVVLILFPVISVTDDIVMAQNPAETDCCQRKDHARASTHSTLHPVTVFVPALSRDLSTDSTYFAVMGNPLAPVVVTPALESIQNRPPPTA